MSSHSKAHEANCASHRNEMGSGCDCYITRGNTPPGYLHSGRQMVICPWCGESQQDNDIPDQGKGFACTDCGRSFRCYVVLMPIYTTERKE